MTEEADEIEVDWEPPVSDQVQCDNCVVIAPYGWEGLAEGKFPLFRIQQKTGDVEILESMDKPWRQAGKADRAATVRAVK